MQKKISFTHTHTKERKFYEIKIYYLYFVLRNLHKNIYYLLFLFLSHIKYKFLKT